jgi:hypothetical protein
MVPGLPIAGIQFDDSFSMRIGQRLKTVFHALLDNGPMVLERVPSRLDLFDVLQVSIHRDPDLGQFAVQFNHRSILGLNLNGQAFGGIEDFPHEDSAIPQFDNVGCCRDRPRNHQCRRHHFANKPWVHEPCSHGPWDHGN